MTKLMLTLTCMLTIQLKVDMINAWSMLYDEMNDLDWVSANGGFEYTPTFYDVKADGYSVNIDDATEHDWDDFWSSMKDDTIELNIGNSQPWKYNEEEIVKELLHYIRGTYGQHYSAGDDKIQTLDLIEACGDGEAFCRSNILKYASRYDKKGTARRDIMKILHYAVLLMHFNDKNAQRETYPQ